MADQLQPVPLVTPGYKGLNKSQSSVPDLDPGWGIECQNFVMDPTGRLASRSGWVKQTTTPLAGTPAIVAQGELALANGNVFVVSAANNKLYSGTTTLTDITGSLTITGNNWQFFTWNAAIYGVQVGHPLIKWTGSGNFTTITPSSGTVPTGGNSGTGAFGRLFIVGSDNQTIFYCNLLDDTAWSVTGAGSLNMGTVWTKGIDQIVALAAVGAKLVIFGTKQIILYADTNSGVIGLNPNATTFGVYDTIEGTGLAARDTIQATGEGDLTFLSPTGVQSLQRLLSSGRDNPLAPLDAQIRDYFNGYFVAETPNAIRSCYSPANRFYLILLPVSQRIFCYDTRTKLQDGSLRVTEWPSITHTALVSQKSGNLLFGNAGVVGIYSGFLDNNVTYTVLLNTPNFALSPNFENRRKILKRLKAVLYYGGNTNITFMWGVDFQGLTNAKQVALTGALSEYSIAQYSINEYGGGAGLTIQEFPISLTGRWMQFGFAAIVNGSQIAIQQLDCFVKIGNMV